MKTSPKALVFASLIACAFQTPFAQADIALSDQVDFVGDIRGGYFFRQRDQRNGKHNNTDEFRLRVRTGLEWQMNEQWSSRVRVAGRYNTIEQNTLFSFDNNAMASGNLAMGNSSIDELFVQYREDKLQLRVGRFQTKFELQGVARKSLDRNNSPNTEINWTDGLHLSYEVGENGWVSHFIAEHNRGQNGPAQFRSAPLGFADEGSRWSYYTGLENNRKHGAIVQRSIGISFLPDSLYKYGPATPVTDNYSTLVGRLAAEWPVSDQGMSFLLAGEAGYAPNTPTETTSLVGTGSESGHYAWQVTANLMSFVPNHNIGFVVAHADAGWLLSPDFSPNQNAYEIRHQWKINKQSKLESRLRYREDDKDVTGSIQDREDFGGYVRYTYKF
ncbi:MAG: hypothetical protein KDI30_02695 [Pseudomonadales bacterium]|nr:hypothetical protein [Pseudomonadales bacterium]